PEAAIAMSAFVFAGAAQFGATAVLAAGGGAPAAIVAGVLLNARFVPMGVAYAPALRGSALRRAAEGQALVDASWALANRGGGRGRAPVNAARTTIVGLALAPAGLTASGPVALGGRQLPPRALAVIALLAPAILAGLVVTETFGSGSSVVLDERAAGLLAAAVAIRLRASLPIVVVVAAAAAAAARAVA